MTEFKGEVRPIRAYTKHGFNLDGVRCHVDQELVKLIQRSKQIQAEHRERAEQPEDRRNLLLTMRSCLIQQRDREKGAL